MVVEADVSGRPPLTAHNPVSEWLNMGEALNVSNGPMKPIIQGRHLIARGWKPSKLFGAILAKAMEEQEQGVFHDESSAQAWLDDVLPHA